MSSKPKTVDPKFMTPPDTQDITNYRNFQIPINSATTLATENMGRMNRGEDVTGFGFSQPIQQRYAHAQRDLQNSYNTPYSGISNPLLRQGLLTANMNKLNEQKGQELSNAAAGENQFWTGLSAGGQQDAISAQLAQKEALARLTAPQLAQPQVIQGQGLLGGLLGGGASAGVSAALAA